MNDVVGRNNHAGDGDRAAEIDEVDIGVARHHRAGEDEEAGRHRVEVAHRAVGDDPDAAEPGMHMGLHLAPERAEPGIGRVDVLQHRDAGQGRGADVLVIAEANAVGGFAVARMGLARADHPGAGEADDRFQVGKRRHQRPPGEADRAARRRDDLERVADGRRIKGAQRLQALAIGKIGHRGTLRWGQGQGSPEALWAMPSARKGFSPAAVSRMIDPDV